MDGTFDLIHVFHHNEEIVPYPHTVPADQEIMKQLEHRVEKAGQEAAREVIQACGPFLFE